MFWRNFVFLPDFSKKISAYRLLKPSRRAGEQLSGVVKNLL